MSNSKQKVKEYLEEEPKFRERSNKDRGIVNLLIQKHPTLSILIKEGIISKAILVEMVQEYASMDRSWRKILEENESLRGSDYGDK